MRGPEPEPLTAASEVGKVSPAFRVGHCGRKNRASPGSQLVSHGQGPARPGSSRGSASPGQGCPGCVRF